MQTLPVEIAKEITTTFLGDAMALVNGFVRVATHLVMAPVERIANACDVAGLLRERAERAAERERMRRAWRSMSAGTPTAHRPRRRGVFSCLGFLGELT
jgi:hypothetical protein